MVAVHTLCACVCVRLGKATGNYDTGSRFQHAEKLQFAKEDEGPPVEEASEEVKYLYIEDFF